ncbi:MAG: formamidopyrimidine-DNA glycosylase [Calditrichaeota bacterium]|nr:MAG: formamidopyrimidine-DNA glycosylase [Calditrichota bacterium]MBL1206193.1 formamidopyrimidine-DNA glycosylase [Calditrichota bacterium]NOG46017.1 formamidopyrimidine-DNA glycosylase [Calditrichota bacterium]
MPEYPDITVYIERLKSMIEGKQLQKIRFASPFFLRSLDPPVGSINDSKILDIIRIGKRITFEFEDEYFAVLHLMISGRLYWRKPEYKMSIKRDLATFDFDDGSLLITEAATKKRASLHLVKGREQLELFNPGGLEIFSTSFDEFKNAITEENHTLKRTLTDPRILSGIGNAYSDEILHRAKLSPILQSQKMDDGQIENLLEKIKEVLLEWTERLRDEAGEKLPEKVTAFHKQMAVHGRYGQQCPVCNTTVQRIRYVANETNYCPQCQTGGKLLADRSLSRLLKKDWPRTPEELDEKLGRKT